MSNNSSLDSTSSTLPNETNLDDQEAIVRLRKPSVVIFGFHGTIAPVDWEDKCIAIYVKENLRSYLDQYWNSNDVFTLILKLKEQSFDEHFVYETANAPLIINFDNSFSNKADVLNSVYMFVMWQVNKLRISLESLCLVRLCWTMGYQQKKIQTMFV